MCIDVSWHIINVSCCKTFEYQEEIVSDMKYALQINIIYKNDNNIFTTCTLIDIFLTLSGYFISNITLSI